jgi:hypothetical protein
MRQRALLVLVGLCLSNAACTVGMDGHRAFVPPLSATAPNPAPTPAPAPPPHSATIPMVPVGEVVRFELSDEEWACAAAGNRCRSFNVVTPINGELVVAITSTTDDTSFLSLLEMYIVPGADYWDVGPGPQITAHAAVRAGATYEIRMFTYVAPHVELELRATVTPR